MFVLCKKHLEVERCSAGISLYEIKSKKNKIKKYSNTEYDVNVFKMYIELFWQLTLECVDNCNALWLRIDNVWHLAFSVSEYNYNKNK